MWRSPGSRGFDSKRNQVGLTMIRKFALALTLQATQPVMLQGEAGYSQKGPLVRQASHYYSEPQLAVQGRIQRGAEGANPRAVAVTGRAWLDHEWSDEYLPQKPSAGTGSASTSSTAAR